jgi:hypothetical protein
VQRQSKEAACLLKLWGFFDSGEVWYELIAAGLDPAAEVNAPVWLPAIAENGAAFSEAMGLLSRYSLAEGREGTRLRRQTKLSAAASRAWGPRYVGYTFCRGPFILTVGYRCDTRLRKHANRFCQDAPLTSQLGETLNTYSDTQSNQSRGNYSSLTLGYHLVALKLGRSSITMV